MPEFKPSGLKPFRWIDRADDAAFGDGVSRPLPGVRTRDYKLKVQDLNTTPMVVYPFKAENKTQAMKYAKARWPLATVTFID